MIFDDLNQLEEDVLLYYLEKVFLKTLQGTHLLRMFFLNMEFELRMIKETNICLLVEILSFLNTELQQ